MAAPGFGFSVGDFISGIQLTGQVIDALRTSNTAPAEYKCALTLLQTLHCLLQQFVDTPIAGNEESQARAVACAKEAITCVQRFATRIGRLEHALGLPHEATRLTLKKRVARVPSKLKWALCTKDDLASFTNTVMPHVSMVQLYLQMQQCSPRNVPQARMTIPTETSAAIETHQRRLEQDLEDVGIDNDISRKSPVLCARAINSHRGPIATASFGSPVGRIIVAIQVDGKGVRELVATIGTIMNLMWSLFAKLLGASSSVPARPTTSLDTDIVVTDALGRVIRLPYEHFQISWMMVYARLSVAFEDCPGELKVQEGSYVMRCGHREPGDELDADNWNTVSPGAKLSMVLVIESGDYSPTECPACGLDYEAFLSTDDGEQFMRKWITCAKCGIVQDTCYQSHYHSLHTDNFICPQTYQDSTWECDFQHLSNMDHEWEGSSHEGVDVHAFKMVRRFTHICLDRDRCFANARSLRAHWENSCGVIEEVDDIDDSDREDEDNHSESVSDADSDCASMTDSDSPD